MAKKIELTPALLKSQASQMDDLKQQYASLFQDVSKTLNNVNSHWSPYLSKNFSGKISSAQRSFSEVVDALEFGSTAAKQSVTTLESVDVQLARMLNGGGATGSVTAQTPLAYKTASAKSVTKTSAKSSFWDAFLEKYGLNDAVEEFGNAGKLVGLFDKARSASSWDQWLSIGVSAHNTVSKIAKDYNNYMKIGRAIGTDKAVSYFLKKEMGFRAVGHASVASSPLSRFYNNLHNTTSTFNLEEAFSPLTGAKGVKTAVVSWAGVALNGIGNAFGNLEEQRKSNGSMTTERVVAETITETAIDTIVTYGAASVIGAAITAATGVVAAPVVVAVGTGVAVAAVNAGVESLTGVSATEWASDHILDTVEGVGKRFHDGTKAVGDWFNNLSFAW